MLRERGREGGGERKEGGSERDGVAEPAWAGGREGKGWLKRSPQT